MITLAVDTAAHLCAACVYDGDRDKVLASVTEDIGRGHAERLFAVIGKALEQAALDYGHLQRLGVCIGPGSFTGVRVGVAAMRGLSLALSIPAVGITLFEALAETAPKGTSLMVLLDARRGEVYAQLYDGLCNPDGPPAVLSVADAAHLARQSGAALTGSGARLLFEADDPLTETIIGDASTADIDMIARLAARAPAPDTPPRPLYLRSADAKPQSGFAVARQGAEP